MADFLDRLVARSLGTLASVQPRRPARFEPNPSAPPSPFLDDDSAPDHLASDGVHDVRSAPRPRMPRPPSDVDVDPDADAKLAPERAPATILAGRPAVIPPPPSPGIAAPPEPPASEQGAGPPRHHGQVTPAPAASSVPRHARVTEPPPAPHPERSGESAAALPEPVPPHPGQPRAPAAAPLEPAPQPLPAAPRGPLPVATRRHAGDSEATGTAAPHAPAAPSPPITVTIGRIEVKSGPAPTPARPAAPPSRPRPALTLDAYLERARRRR